MATGWNDCATCAAVSRFELASTTRMWQCGQFAETMSTSSDCSASQPSFTPGSGDGCPDWFTTRMQPFFLPQAGSPNCLRYTARSLTILGSPPNSITATRPVDFFSFAIDVML